jgi:hypothetical protein
VGLIPTVDQPSPAFIHVDIDDLWAIAECYGFSVAEAWAHHVSTDALPRFASLFNSFGISATFFTVGRDLQHAPYVALMQQMLKAGHKIASHSQSHSLHFRDLPASELANEIDGATQAIVDHLNVQPIGFRAPGYGHSTQLVQLLNERGYRYDASLMPSPFGGVFRFMDSRLQQGKPEIKKTQYPLLSDTWHSLYPTPIDGSRLIEIPSAASPLLRLPFQAGVCMRLGYPYFRACFEPFLWNRALPFVFLFHAADLADFSPVPGNFFRQSSFFNKSITDRLELARRFLEIITRYRRVTTTEEWLS